MNLPSRKVLIITYYFPPSGGAGVQRTLKFVKYLRKFGWEPVVLTVKNGDYPAYDESLFTDVPAKIKVYRTRIFEPYRLYRKFTGKRENESTDIATLTPDDKARPKLSERLSEWVRSAFFVPDARIAWLFFASKAAIKIAKEENIGVIFSSAPPYTTHLIGLRLRRKLGLPWVADFRDSWIGWLSAPQRRPRLSSFIENKMERAVLSSADKILTVSKGVRADLLSRHDHVDGRNWTLLPNGFDKADFEALGTLPKFEKTTVTYLGSLYGARNPEYLIRALEDLHERDPDLPEKLAFRFIGRVGEPILAHINASPVARLFEFVPYLPHSESLSELLRSQVSLLIIDDAPANRGILTGKLYEYIGAGNEILALAPEGEASELILSHKLGWVAPPKDQNAIQAVLLEILGRKKLSAEVRNNGTDIRDQFERQKLTGKLASIFDQLVERAEEPSELAATPAENRLNSPNTKSVE
ncbi:glycosyltransferase family 4 protein [bacterium]|nr:glycosyltransferase family 4 protein [bacterium]